MDKKELELKLNPFFTELKKRLRYKDICIVDSYPGLGLQLYTISIIAPNISDSKYSAALRSAFNILFKTTTVQVRKHIFTMCIKTQSNIHCSEVELEIKAFSQTYL